MDGAVYRVECQQEAGVTRDAEEPLRILWEIGYRWAPDASRASCSMRLTRW